MTVSEEVTIKKRSLIVDTEDEDEILFANEDCAMNDQKDPPTKPEKDNESGLLFYILEKHQWIFAIWLIPISIIYDIFWWVRTRWNYFICKSNANRKHEEKVGFIANF